MKVARRTLLRRTVQGRRRVWIAGPGRWLVGALFPLVPALVVAAAPAAQVMPAFLFLAAVVGAAVLAGRGPGLLSAIVSTGTLLLVTAWPHRPPPTDPAIRWAWAVVFLGLTALTVTWVDSLLSDAARRATAVLDPLVEAAPVGIALLDRDLRFVRVNDALARFGRQPPSAHLGRSLSEMLPSVPGELSEQLRGVLISGQPLGHQLATLLAPDGSTRQLMVDAFPVRLSGGPTGPITGVGAVMADVTERHRLEQLEREAEQLQATARISHRLLESQRIAQLAGFEINVADQRSAWSDELCALMGRTTPPATEEEARAHVHPDELDRVLAIQEKAIATGAPFTIETRMVRTDGAIREILVHAEAVRAGDNPDAAVVGLWGVVQDVTEVKAAQREIAAAQRSIEVARNEARAERRVLELFQRAMLPAELPTIPGGELAADYLAVADRIDVGGDWYDAFPLPDGRIALSIGDVVGHDQHAAAIMGQVRAVNRGYALERPEPGSVLTRLNRLLTIGYPSGTLISAVSVLYDPGTGVVTWANAGHPHPLLATPATDGDGIRVTTLESTEPILGAAPGREYPTRTLTLPPGGTLLCYTDGLIERRASDLDAGKARLIALLTEILVAPVVGTELVDRITAGMAAEGPVEDDVCVLALQRGEDAT